VFKVEELLPPIIIPPIQYPPLGISPEDIIAGSSILEKNHSIIVSCQYDDKTCSNPIAGYYNGTWWVNFGTGWIPSNVSIKSDEEQYTNLDRNYANELVILTKSGDQYIVVKGDKLIIDITFHNVTEINGNNSLIVVYLKVLVFNPDKDANMFIEVKVSLINSTDNSKQISSYATFSSAKVGGAAEGKLVIYEGYAMFPLKQFGIFDNNILGSSSSTFNINVCLSGDADKGVMYIGIEYLIIITY